MFYFVPAWYSQDEKWGDQTQCWFRVLERMSFDDTINQLKMFQEGKEVTCAVLLNYQPQLRYFLHKQGLLGQNYWSFFDHIQNVTAKGTKLIDFKLLNWPEKTHFVYTPFAVLAQNAGEDLAYIHFAENGNLFYIDFQEDGDLARRYVFDDRGFLSSILYYANNEPSHRDYLNEAGVWQVREYLGSDSKIEVNILADMIFSKPVYESWEELIAEKLASFVKVKLTKSDFVVFAAHPQHNSLVLEIFKEHTKVVSFFQTRNQENKWGNLSDLHQEAKFFVADSQKMVDELDEEQVSQNLEKKIISRMSPFDTRLQLGHSQSVKELKIHFFIDTISWEELLDYLPTIFSIMEKNLAIELNLVTYNLNYPVQKVEQAIFELLSEQFDVTHFQKRRQDSGENQLDEGEMELSRVAVTIFTNENQLFKQLDTTRLVLDLGQEPDLYTQIASISVGIPQINRVKTDYVSHQENGWIITNKSDLSEALLYYFDGLSNWNRSLVYTVQKMGEYTSGRILEQWKNLLEG